MVAPSGPGVERVPALGYGRPQSYRVEVTDVIGQEPWRPPPAVERAVGAILLVAVLTAATVFVVHDRRAAARMALRAATVSVADPHSGDQGATSSDYLLTNASHRTLHLVSAKLDASTQVPLNRDLRPGATIAVTMPLPSSCGVHLPEDRPATLLVRFRVAGKQREARLDVRGTAASYSFRTALQARCADFLLEGAVTGAVIALHPRLVVDLRLTNVSRTATSVRSVRLADGFTVSGGLVDVPAAVGVNQPTEVRTSVAVHVTDCSAVRAFVGSYTGLAYVPRFTVVLRQGDEVDLDPGGVPLVAAVSATVLGTCS
jgi:hypothetical protein